MENNEVVIETALDTAPVENDTEKVNRAVENMAESSKEAVDGLKKHMNSLFSDVNTAGIDALSEDYRKQVQKMVDMEKDLENLWAKRDAYENAGGAHTEYFIDLDKQIDKAEGKYDELSAKTYELGKALGYTEDMQVEFANSLRAGMTDVRNEADKVKESLNSISANTDGYKEINKQTEKVSENIGEVSDKTESLRKELNKTENTQEKYAESLRKVVPEAKKAGKNIDEVSKKAKSSSKNFKIVNNTVKSTGLSFGKLIPKLLACGIGARTLYDGIQKLKNATKEGVTNLAKWNDGNNDTNKALSNLTSSVNAFKNSLGAAFEPILSVAEPMLTKLIDKATEAANSMAMLIAKISGKSTYTKAIKLQKDYAQAIEDSANASKQLAGFHKLNLINTNSGSGGSSTEQEFKTEQIDTTAYDGALSKLEKIKTIGSEIVSQITSGVNFEGIGKDVESIGKQILGILGDESVGDAALKFVNSFIKGILRQTKSFVTVAGTLAENIVGGIEYYLSNNSDRIKRYLISMFEIGSDLSELQGDFSEAISFIFEPFGDEDGQRLTGNLIGIFSSAFMGITQFASKTGYSIISALETPIIDNKDGFRKAFGDLVGVLADFSDTVKKCVDDIADSLDQLYEKYIGPCLQDISDGFSDTLSKLLTFWNTYIGPFLKDMAKDFDKLYEEHLKPFFDSVFKLFGELALLISTIYNNVLKPVIDWIIENVLPYLLPILYKLKEHTFNTIGNIVDKLNGFVTVLTGLIEFLTGIFSGDWEKAWQGIKDIFQGLKLLSPISDFIDGIEKNMGSIGSIMSDTWRDVKVEINRIIGGFEKMANGIVKAINTIVNSLNGLSFDIPDWIPGYGGKKFSLNLKTLKEVKLPRLANGGVIPPNKEFLAVLGDQKKGTNIEAPLDTIKLALAEVLRDFKGASGQKQIVVPVIINGREVFKVIADENQKYKNANGGNSAFA